MQLSAGTTLEDRYVVLGPLGEGGMASVLLVRHLRLGTLHALKVLHGGSPSVRARLLREGQVQGNLRHGNVLPVTDILEVDGAPGLVMEYVDGPDLAQLLDQLRLTPEQADALARPILDGVVAAHEAGLVHRDLKPANVLLAVQSGRLIPKIADFGLAKVLEESDPTAHRTRSGVAMGTPAYMAPEQIRDASRVDARADVFALGAILFELVSGQMAFRGTDSFELLQQVVEGRFEDVRSVAPGLPDGMVDAIHGALVADPEARIQSAAALREVWVGARPEPRPEWPDLDALRSAEAPAPGPSGGTWSGGAGETWSPGARSMDPETGPTLPEPTSPAEALVPDADPGFAGTRRWRAAVWVAALLVLGGPIAWFTMRGEPAPAPDHVLTSTSVVRISDDPVIQAQFEEGWQLFLDAEFRLAERKLESVADSDPADPLAWILLSQTRMARDDSAGGVAAAWAAFDKGKTFDSPLSDLLPHMAQTATAAGWESEHGQAIFQHLEDHPTDYLMPLMPLYGPGGLRPPDQVVQSMFDTALERDPEPLVAYALLASDRISRGRWSEALETVERGLEKDPGAPPLLARKGAALLGAGRFEEARATLLEASQADPGLERARIDLAVAARVTGDDALLDDLERSLLGPTSPIETRVAYAIEMGVTAIGTGEWEAGVARIRAAEAEAREAGRWEEVRRLMDVQRGLFLLAGDGGALRALVERNREMVAAPELGAAARQRASMQQLVLEAIAAAYAGEVDEARRLLARQQELPDAGPLDAQAIGNALAVAERQPEALRFVHYDESCQDRAAIALFTHRAGGEAEALLREVVVEPVCSAVGLDPWLQQMAREALGD